MKIRWPWRKKQDDELARVVEELENLFQPVKPREEFVMDLRDNLLNQPKPPWLPLPTAGWQLILMIGGGIISAFLLVLGGIRLFANLFKRDKKGEDSDSTPDIEQTEDPPTTA